LPSDVTPAVLKVYNEEFTLPQVAFNARATIVGRVTAEKKYVLRHRGQIVMDVDIEFLTGTIADELAHAEMPSHEKRDEALVYPEISVDEIVGILPRILAHRDVCSREPLYRRYDAVVRGATVIARGAGDAGVLAPVPGAPFGVALAVAGNPRYGRLDPRRAAELAVVLAACRTIAVGARPIGLTDCLNFGNPRKLEQYSEFVASVDGLGRAARELGLAFVSGNVSLYNESQSGEAVPASAIVGCIGAIDDLKLAVTPGFKRAGAPILLLGNAGAGLGGSVLDELLGIEDDNLPYFEYARLRADLALLARAMQTGIVSACAAVADGGTLAAVARAIFAAHDGGRHLGVELDGNVGYGESPGFVLEVSDEARFAALASELGATVRRIGVVSDTAHFVIDDESIHVTELAAIWSQPLAEVYP
jgi:phosphoribosylformylglycinamidine synthase